MRHADARTLEGVEEAARVLDRLRRIRRLDEQHAAAAVLLEELRHLLAEAEEWARVEDPGNPAVERLRRALAEGEETFAQAERTLVA
jgi:hypothetical protein